MSKRNILNFVFVTVLAAVFGIGCQDKWDEHLGSGSVDNSTTIAAKIAADPSLNKFNQFLKLTGYDTVLAASKVYTVWAPNDEALKNSGFDTDTTGLGAFVKNHIAVSSLDQNIGNDTLKIKLLSDKYAAITIGHFDGIEVVGSPKFVKNGVLNIIGQPNPIKQNIWEYFMSTTDASLQKNYISGFTIMVIDSANAKPIGYTSGQPKYASDAPRIARNGYWSTVADLRAENGKYTFFILRNAAFDSEADKLKDFYPNLTYWNTVLDLTVKGVYTPDKLPDTLLSIRGVKVPVNKSAIVRTYNASNGIVYVVDALPFRLKDKIPQIKIEGELPFSFRSSKAANTHYRTKLDSLGVLYKDIEIFKHATAEYYVEYRTPMAAKGKYKVFARAISGTSGDLVSAAFTQRYFVADTAATTTYPTAATFTHIVNPRTYKEIELGTFENLTYRSLRLRLVSANSTAEAVNPLILDYIRFEPILP